MDRGGGGHGGDVEASSSSARAPAPGPDRSFADLYRRYHDRVWRTLGCLGVPEASVDDAVQEVFLVVHRRLGDPDQYTSVKSWIYAVARRVAWHHHRTHARRRRRLEAVQREPEPPASVSPEEQVARSEAVVVMRRFLDTLDDAQRVVFVLAEIEGLTAPEISQVVQAKVSTVHSRLRLARRRFERIAAAHEKRRAREESRV